MRTDRAVPGVALAIILALTLATAPAIGLLHVPEPQRFAGPGLGEGNASFSDVRAPGQVRFVRGSYGSGAYQLRAPTVSLTVQAVEGRPMLIYALDVDELGYSRRTNTALTADRTGPLALAFDPVTFDRSELTRDRYAATIRVLLRGSGPDRVLYRRNVTAEVVE